VSRPRSRIRRASPAWVPLNATAPLESPCLEVPDSSTTLLPTDFLLRGQAARDPAALAARLGEQFRLQNREVLDLVGVSVQTRFDGTHVGLEVTSGTTVGAIPLQSPTSGRAELGLVIRPRYDWLGLGAMLGQMGWKVLPAPLALSNLPRSERRVPPWVLSAIVLGRIQALLGSMQRRFEMTESIRPAPHGHVDWQRYACRHITRGQFTQVPCQHPELGADLPLQGAIHFTLRRHLASLESQRQAGSFVLSLILWCGRLVDEVRTAPPRVPTDLQMRAWKQGRLRSSILEEGLDAIAWTVDERGLAGLCDLHGLPWSLSMETFFEAWVESVVQQVARRIGGVVRSGRQRQTQVPILWDPPYQGSQRFLLPDLRIESASGVIIVDAKYKDHWEELAVTRWGEWEERIRERHRSDLLQILAYTSVLDSSRLAACLVYPCRRSTWESLHERGRLFHRGTVGLDSRTVQLLLTAVPMDAQADVAVDLLAMELDRMLTA
jgi:hypothetical protein